MGLLQLRFEDQTQAATIYSTWDDDETPEMTVVLASLQDTFRAQTGAPFEHPAWLRALEICHAVQSEMPEADLTDRFAAALGRFLSRGPTVSGATELASLAISFDAHYMRPYPDDRAYASEDHGWDGKPHISIRMTQDDHGHGPETVLTIVPHPETETYFNYSPNENDGDTWVRGSRREIERRIRALAPFASDLIRVSQEPGKAPVVTTRLDATTVATAYARVLDMPLAAHVPIHGPLRRHPAWTPEAGTRTICASEQGFLVFRFVRPAYPEIDMPEEVLTLKRKGGRSDLPTVLSRIAALPMLPTHMEVTDDRTAMPFHDAADWCVRAENPQKRWKGAPERNPDIAVRVRQAERYALSSAAPNFRRVMQGYISYLFTAEPGMWEVFPDGVVRPENFDVGVEVTRSLPRNMVGGWIVRSSSDPEPQSDSPDATNLTSILTIKPAPEHVEWLRDDPEFAKACDLLRAWQDAFEPLRLRTLGVNRTSCVLRHNFELLFLATVHARVAGMSVPEATPFGSLPKLPPYDRDPYMARFQILEDESLLDPDEIEEQRKLIERLARREKDLTLDLSWLEGYDPVPASSDEV